MTRRFQVEIGVRWQLVPRGTMKWREWAFSPYAAVVWPGRELQHKEMIDGTRGPGWMLSEREPERDPVTNLFKTHWYARYWRLSLALCVLGCDFGLGVLYRPRNELDARACVPSESVP